MNTGDAGTHPNAPNTPTARTEYGQDHATARGSSGVVECRGKAEAGPSTSVSILNFFNGPTRVTFL